MKKKGDKKWKERTKRQNTCDRRKGEKRTTKKG